MNWKIWAMVVVLGALAWFGWTKLSPANGDFRLTLLHTNDVHARYEPFQPWGEPVQGGAARLSTLVQETRALECNVLLVDAGDQFQGTLYYNVGGAALVAEVMNAVGYDAMAVGNHEFDSGPSELAKLIDIADFPVLSANISAQDEVRLAERLSDYATFQVGGETVGVFGLTSEHTAIASNPGPSIVFADAFESARAVVDEMEAQGIDKIIALTHLGLERDMALASQVAGIDVIVGGHSHTLLGESEGAAGFYPQVLLSPADEPVVVVTAYEWGKVLGSVEILFDDRGIVLGAEGEPIPIGEEIEEDPAVAAILSAVVPRIEALKEQTVGATEVDLDGARERVRTQETNLGNLICDAILWKTESLGAQIALQNGGGIRASIPAGPVTMGQVLEVLPFGNEISIVEVSGRQLLAALENGVSKVEEGAGRFAHVSGLRIRFDPAANPGSRILGAEVQDAVSGTYAPLREEAAYTVATNSFLAGGGDEYSMFPGAVARYDTGFLISDVLAEYLEEKGHVAPTAEGRIEAVSPAG